MATAIRFLGWRDLAPDVHAFDRARADAIAIEALEDAMGGRSRSGVDRANVEAALDRAFLAEFGAWAAGWSWAASEPGGGGPVRGWCCARDSLFREGEPDSASALRAAAALAEWRAFLEELDRLFGELPPAIVPDVEHDVGVAATRLLALVVERTSADDAWYQTFSLVLVWYLEAKGHSALRVRPLVSEVVQGHFHSWIAPEPAVAEAACRALAGEVAYRQGTPPRRDDATAEWLAHRKNAFAHFSPSKEHAPLRRDGHRRFITGPERARDEARAAAMDVALDACRISASAGEALTFERLASFQAIVLGASEARFRTTDAFAKAGRERYPVEGAAERFAACLAEANQGGSPILRATRVYLDVCFFHPFVDGNGRAARLALDHVLTRAGLGVHSLEPIVLVARNADDHGVGFYLAYVVNHLAGRLVNR